ncbi:hypothetical protein PIB30_059567 [Stylosanthes scabra]|uniref:Uncharacterized protein n=1 Tax=Stylosanthes scabra TaxID=79078 RepID=A0ABU6YLH9_9FABA|nr:hypothetical protein [Stylosanthes scabra]
MIAALVVMEDLGSATYPGLSLSLQFSHRDVFSGLHSVPPICPSLAGYVFSYLPQIFALHSYRAPPSSAAAATATALHCFGPLLTRSLFRLMTG